MARRNYTDEQKAAVLARVEEVGVVAAAKEAGIDRKTVSNWAKAAKNADADVAPAKPKQEKPKQDKPKVEKPKVEKPEQKKPEQPAEEKKPVKVKQAEKEAAAKLEPETIKETVAVGQKVKGETKMSEKKDKKDVKGKFPKMMPFMPNKEWTDKIKNSKVKDGFRENMKTFWTKKIELEKSSIEAFKDHWNMKYDLLMEMQDAVVGALPEETKLPVSPKGIMDEVKKFQELSKTHFTEQADSIVDFYFQGEEQLLDVLYETMAKKKETAAEEA